jgi:D-galacturonate reductase
VEFGGLPGNRPGRLRQMQDLAYNDLSADRNTVAVVQAMEAILARHAGGEPGGVVEVNGPLGGLVLRLPGKAEAVVLYPDRV